MNRRKFIALASGAAVLPVAASAQGSDQKGLPTVAFVALSSEEATRPNTEAFQSGLAALGHIEGKNIRVFYRFADGNVERFTEMTTEVVSLGASIIVTASTTAIRAAHRAAPNVCNYINGERRPSPNGMGADAGKAGRYDHRPLPRGEYGRKASRIA